MKYNRIPRGFHLPFWFSSRKLPKRKIFLAKKRFSDCNVLAVSPADWAAKCINFEVSTGYRHAAGDVTHSESRTVSVFKRRSIDWLSWRSRWIVLLFEFVFLQIFLPQLCCCLRNFSVPERFSCFYWLKNGPTEAIGGAGLEPHGEHAERSQQEAEGIRREDAGELFGNFKTRQGSVMWILKAICPESSLTFFSFDRSRTIAHQSKCKWPNRNSWRWPSGLLMW